MSVMASRDSQAGAEGSPIRLDHLSLDAWTLCREFVQRMVSDAQAAAVSDHPGHPVPEVDWEPIWRAGEGAPSDEAAMGRIIRAASEAARGIALGAPSRSHCRHDPIESMANSARGLFRTVRCPTGAMPSTWRLP